MTRESIAQYSNCNFLCNIDFEDEKLVQSGQFGFFDQDRVSCWNTTATDRMIEIWGSGFGGVPAYSGNQFAELNANMVSTLFQNFTAALGSVAEISFAHRGRAGVDVLRVEIGPAGGPYADLGNFSAATTQWNFNKINYTFPITGSTNYVIRFVSVSAAGGATVGNFLDAISVKLIPPEVTIVTIPPRCPDQSNGSIAVIPLKGSMPFSYLWNDPSNSKDSVLINLISGSYQLVVSDFYGCKSNYTILLQASSRNDTIGIRDSACVHYTWDANGLTYSRSGLYSAILKNSSGCDSMVQLQLTIHKPDSLISSIAVCDVYRWPVNGKTYTQSGTYVEVFSNVWSCDSVIILNLEIIPSQIVQDTIRQCDGYTWPVNGKTYYQSGNYTEIFRNQYGCDSVRMLQLIINQKSSSQISITACDSFQLHGVFYNKSGTYFLQEVNANGCDSIIQLQLQIHYSSLQTDSIQICDAFTWQVNGKTYFTSGNYTEVFKTQNGCDSVYKLDLAILQKSVSQMDTFACDSFNFNGVHFTKSGNFTLHYDNSLGCDSIIDLKIEIHPSYVLDEAVKKCNSYYWPVNHTTYSQSGMYSAYLQSSKACDSVLNLHLTIDPPFVRYDTVSALEKYTWPVDKHLYKESGVYRSGFQTKEGCDSILILYLEIRQRGQVWLPNVFTPNGDGVNDHFVVFSSAEIKIIDRMRIFDRWGELLFELKDFTPNTERFGWNGRNQNQAMNPGVFIYTVEWTDTEGDKHLEYGDVSLLR